MNISDLIDQYEQGAKLRGLGPTQMQALVPVRRGLGRKTVAGLTPSATGKYCFERRTGQHTKVHGHRPASCGTIRRELGALAAVLNWAHQKRILKDAPPSIDLPPMSPPREVFLDLQQADALWNYAAMQAREEDCKVGLFTCLALDTWARASSIETLPWSRVDMTRGQIDYRDPLRPETSKRRMPVPISTRLVEALTRRWYDGERAVSEDLVTGPVTQYAWKRFMCGSPLPKVSHITRHDLRRTGISLAVARGVDMNRIAQMAGDRLETIITHYARYAPDYLAGVVE